MTGSIFYDTVIDRSTQLFELNVEYAIPGYYDPESDEYFGDTSWGVSFIQAGGSQPGTGGYGSESEAVYLSLGLTDDGAVHRYRIDFHAMNTFSASAVAQSWNVIEAASVTTALTLAGGDGIDFIIGGNASDALRGLGGDDLLDGGDGDDRLIGGAGADRLAGGAGANVLIGGAGNDIYTIISALDELIEADVGGYDSVVAGIDYTLGDHVESLQLTGAASVGTGNALDNMILGNSAANILSGLDGNDDLRGGFGDDILRGGDGDDRLEGGVGADILEGGAGDDAYYLDSALDRIIEDADSGIDTVYLQGVDGHVLAADVENLVRADAFALIATGNALANRITGGAANDKIHGADGDDWLIGGLGNDVLTGGRGADTIVGGDGLDTAGYANATTAIHIDLAAGIASGGEANGDLLIGIEGVIGGSGDDRLRGDAAANRLDGGVGDDILTGRDGNDTLGGRTGADVLDGGNGRDTASYAGSAVAVAIDLAALTIRGGDAEGDTFIGIESVTGGDGDDTLTGDAAANTLSGGAGGDTIDSGDGDDIVNGGSGADLLAGGAGFDRLSFAGSRGGVTVDLGAGTASGGDATGDSFTGFEGLIGGARPDMLTGDDGDNRIDGRQGDDGIDGGDGDDVVSGGGGADTMDGGLGTDTLSYAASATGLYASLNDGFGLNGDAAGDHFENFENLVGSRFGDALYGDDGANTIRGGGGSDVLNGYGGDDRVIGGDGGDVFTFGPGGGTDTIVDFDTASGDTVDNYFGAAFDSFAEIQAAATATGAGGGDTTITFDDGSVLVLLGVSLATLSADDFTFGF